MRSLAITCLLVLVGCASAPPAQKNVDGADISPLASEHIAVSYHVIHPQINYVETLYRVFWLETKASTQNFSGIWMPDRDMSEFAVERMRAQGFKAESVYTLASAPAISAANQEVGNAAKEKAALPHPQLPKVKLLPADIFFTAPPSAAEFSALANELRAKGYRYLAQLTSMDLSADAPGYGLIIVTSMPNLRVVDLHTNKVVWAKNVQHGEPYQLGGNFMHLEKDGMAKLKEGMKLGIAKLDFAQQFGVLPK